MLRHADDRHDDDRGADDGGPSPGKRTRTQGVSGGGAPLPGPLAVQMSRAFDADFSQVRVHEGAHVSALGADAYALGHEVHFAPGRFAPDTVPGRELIGHELAHVVQQGHTHVAQARGATLHDAAALEAEADHAGAAAARGAPIGITLSNVGPLPSVQRKITRGPAAAAATAKEAGQPTPYAGDREALRKAVVARLIAPATHAARLGEYLDPANDQRTLAVGANDTDAQIVDRLVATLEPPQAADGKRGSKRALDTASATASTASAGAGASGGATASMSSSAAAAAAAPVAADEKGILPFRLPDETSAAQDASIQQILTMIRDRGASAALTALLDIIDSSNRSYLQIDVQVVPEGGAIHGDTGVYVGRGRTPMSTTMQEQLLVDPTPLVAADLQLTIGVRVYVRASTPPHEIATTILHELELHATHAAIAAVNIERVRARSGGNADQILGTIMQYMRRQDDHAHIGRQIALVESAARMMQATATTAFGEWGQHLFQSVCRDAIEQFTAGAMSGADDRAPDQLVHLQAVIDGLGGTTAPAGPLPARLAVAHPYGDVVTRNNHGAELTEPQILDRLAIGVRERRGMLVMVEALATEYGVPRARTIALYDTHIAPQIYVECRAWTGGEPELLFMMMEQYGVPRPVTFMFMERDAAAKDGGDTKQTASAASAASAAPDHKHKSGGADAKDKRVEAPALAIGSGGLKVPREPMFWLDADEDDWTPLTNHYVPRQVLAAHARIAPGTCVNVEGYLMRVGYTNNPELPGASAVKGSSHGTHMALRLRIVGG